MNRTVAEYTVMALAMMLTLMTAACSESDTTVASEPASEPEVVCPAISIGVADMESRGVSRALEPLNPDIEKTINTLAVFEFNSEGMHLRSDHTFHFIDFVHGTVDGEEGIIPIAEDGVIEEKLDYLQFNAYKNGILCLVANIEIKDVEDLYTNPVYHEPGQSNERLSFDKFCTWNLKINYLLPGPTVYDETRTGHVDPIYMFGYYRGDVVSNSLVTVNLGRLVSRIDLSIMNETGEDITKRLGYHFDNIVNFSYFFPMEKEVPPNDGAGKARVIVCSGLKEDGSVDPVTNAVTVPDPVFHKDDIHTRYFYIGAHSASNIDEATKLHLFYNRRILVGEDDPSNMENSVQVPLCNINPAYAAQVKNGYSLSRNTRYNFVIRLRKRETAPANPASLARMSAAPDALLVEPVARTSDPAVTGEYIVYLP